MNAGRSFLLLPFAVLGCSGPSQSQTAREESCAVPAPTECPDPAPTFADVEPIFDAYCNSAPCHRPGNPDGNWPLETYEHIKSWQDAVRDELLNCTMPPEEGPPLPPDERLLLMQWTRCNMPR